MVKNIVENRQKDFANRCQENHNNDKLEGLGYQAPQNVLATIFGGATTPPSMRQAKLLWREVYTVFPSPAISPLLRWSGIPIKFDRNDHPKSPQE